MESLWLSSRALECGIGRSDVQFLIGTQIFFSLCPTLSSWQDEKTSCSISLQSSKPSLLFNKFKFKVHPHYQNQYQDTLLTCQPAKNQVTESISQYQSTLVNIRQHCPTLVKIKQLADCCLWSLILNLKKISVGALTKVGIKSTLMSWHVDKVTGNTIACKMIMEQE